MTESLGTGRRLIPRDELSARIDLDETVSAVYLDGTGRNVLFLGGTRSMWAPESVLDSTFGAVADIEGATAPDPHSVNAGPLGGVMKCGHMTTGDGEVAICGWADHGSLAMAEFINRQEPESAALLRDIRHATETRS